MIRSNRESGFERFDVVMEPLKDELLAVIIEFKVHNPSKENSLEETVRAVHEQVEKKQYAAALLEKGIPAERIKKYGFAFEGKNVLIG